MANHYALDRDLMRVKGTRDRITKLFAKRTPPLEDIGRSLLRAVGGKSTYGEELNALRAGRLEDYRSLYDVFSKERGYKLAERKQASAEKQHVWEKLKAAREQGNTDAAAILKAVEFYSGDDLKDRRVLAEELEKLPGDVTALNAWTIASQTANRLALTGRFSGKGGSKYGAPVTVQGPSGPELVRFPQGSGEPVPVQGYSPYTKPGEGPALVQIANAYRDAMAKSGNAVSELQALQWAKTSVGKSQKDIWLSVYTGLVRGMADPEDAKTTADEITKYLMNLQTGGEQQPLAGGSVGLSPAGPAQAATGPAAPAEPLASVTPIPGGLGPGEQSPYPWRKPSMEGVNLLPGTVGEYAPQPGSIETMTREEIVALAISGQELSQDEVDRLMARMDALGVPR